MGILKFMTRVGDANFVFNFPLICFTYSKFWWGWGLLVYPILLFSLPLAERSPSMTEILLTGTLHINSSNQNLHTKHQNYQ